MNEPPRGFPRKRGRRSESTPAATEPGPQTTGAASRSLRRRYPRAVSEPGTLNRGPEKVRSSRLLVLAVLAIPAIAGLACTPSTTARFEPELRAECERFEAAVDRGDAHAVASFFLPDADRVNASGDWAHGRAEIERQYVALFARRRADPSTRPFRPEVAIRFVDTDLAIVDGRWHGTRGGKAVAGHYTIVAVRRDGEWKFALGRGWDLPGTAS